MFFHSFDETIEVEIEYPETGEATGISVTIDMVRAERSARSVRRRNRSLSDDFRTRAELVADAIVGWTCRSGMNVGMAFTDCATAMLADPSRWFIVEQIETAIIERTRTMLAKRDDLIDFATAAFMGKPEKEIPDFPEEMHHVWSWFLDLSRRRTTGMAPNAIGYSEIDAYCRLFGIEMMPWEIDTLTCLDEEVLDAIRKRKDKKGVDGISNLTNAADGAAVKSLLRGFKNRKPQPVTEQGGESQ